MSWYETEIHKFVIGEIRTDGWVSDWRREQERRRKEEMGKRVFVRMPEIKIVRPKKARPSRAKPRPGFTGMGVPTGMTNVEYNKYLRRLRRSQGMCGSCGAIALKGSYSCAACLEKKAIYYCKKMGKPYVPKTVERMSCKDCGKLLKSNNHYGYCQAHYRKRRHQLKQAA